MRIWWGPLSLLVIACLLGCSDDGAGSSATASVTSDPGEGTTAAEGTDTGGDGEGFCSHQCTHDIDCFVSGFDVDAECIDNVCDSPDCTSDEQCVAKLSGWTGFGGPSARLAEASAWGSATSASMCSAKDGACSGLPTSALVPIC